MNRAQAKGIRKQAEEPVKATQAKFSGEMDKLQT